MTRKPPTASNYLAALDLDGARLPRLTVNAGARANGALVRPSSDLDVSELLRLEARYHAAFEATGDGLVIYTSSGVMVEVNSAFCAMNGYAPEELIGQNVIMLIHPDYHDLFYQFVETVVNGGSLYARAMNVRKDGSVFPVDVHGTVLFDVGEPLIVGVARDVTELVRTYELLEQRVEERTCELKAAHDRLQQWNKALEVEVTSRTREIQRSSRELTTRVLQAQETERHRISRELHDETAQALSTLLINLDFLEQHLPDNHPPLHEGLDRVRAIAKRTLDEVRALAHALRPSVLDDLGLVAALQWCSKEHTTTFGVPVEVRVEQVPVGRLAPEVELTIFRMAQEALMNSGKHARAHHVTLSLSFPGGAVQLVVEDDGVGFTPSSLHDPGRQEGLGLHGMHERADLIGATVAVSSQPGAGTRITVTAPLWVVESPSPMELE